MFCQTLPQVSLCKINRQNSEFISAFVLSSPSPSGGGVSGGGGGRGSADVLGSLQAAVVRSDRGPVQGAETGENI